MQIDIPVVHIVHIKIKNLRVPLVHTEINFAGDPGACDDTLNLHLRPRSEILSCAAAAAVAAAAAAAVLFEDA